MTKNIVRQKAKQTTTDDKRLLVAENQIEILREQIEFWRELVESLNLELHDKEQQLQATEQELNYTNKELCSALMFERVCLTEAKELSKTILKNNKSASQSLADVLSAIYGSQVQPEELGQIDNISTPLKTLEANESINNSKQVTATPKISGNEIINKSRQIRANSKALTARFNELGIHYIMSQATSKSLCHKFADLIAESKEIKNINMACKKTIIELSPPQKKSNISILNQYKQVGKLKFEETKIYKKMIKITLLVPYHFLQTFRRNVSTAYDVIKN